MRIRAERGIQRGGVGVPEIELVRLQQELAGRTTEETSVRTQEGSILPFGNEARGRRPSRERRQRPRRA